MNNKRVLKLAYTFCFVALSIINWVKVTLDGRTQMTAANLTGVVVAIIILFSYEVKSFLKPVFAIWLFLSIIFVPIACKIVLKTHPYQGQIVTTSINFSICVLIVIRVFLELFEKKKISNVQKGIFVGWILLIVWMIISVNEDIWPIWFGIILGAFYLTEYDKEDTKLLFRALIDGTIISFFILQGAALLFRPFDEVRYSGIFRNPNMNGLFYVGTYAAFICKWFILKKDNKGIFARLLAALFSGALIAFVIFTGSKASLIAVCFETFPFIVFSLKYWEKKFLGLLVYGCSLFMIAIISFPIVYGAIRYIPTIHLHPVFYEAEYSEVRVLPGEPRNSEKYITFEQAVNESFGRFFYMIKRPSDLMSRYSLTLKAYAEELQSEKEEPLFTEEELLEGVSPIELRYRIHKAYINRLNYMGHSNKYDWVLIDEYWYFSYAPHAHNMFIQMAFLYGIPVGILLIGMVFAYLYGIIRMVRSGENEKACIISCFIIGVVVFGMFEENWMLGQMHFTLFFLLFREIVRLPDKNTENQNN